MGNWWSKPDQSPYTETASNGELCNWLNLLYRDKICFQRSAKEVDDIRDAVTIMVREIIAEMGRIDGMFANCTETLVGSAGEGSKISEPDEFDFLIKIYTLSLVPGVHVVRECLDRPGYAHVIIDSDENSQLATQWASMITNGRLKSTEPVSKKGLRDWYSYVMEVAIRNLQENGMDVVKRSTGKLQLKSSVKTYGPSCVCLSRWIPAREYGGALKALHVDIDTVPAIHMTGWPTGVGREEMHTCRQVRETLKESNRFMVIPCGRASCKEGLCFRLTFTNSEVILYNRLSVHHRKCFKILKYLMKTKTIEREKTEQSVLFSYALKAFIFNHDEVCYGEHDTDLGKCIKSLLQDIKVCLERKQPSSDGNSVRIFLPSICVTTHNVYDKDLEEFPLIKKETSIEAIIKFLEDIKDGSENVNPNDLLETDHIVEH